MTAKRPNHVWHVDLTVVPTLAGFWCAWFSFAPPQCWPFCWWTAVVVDHYSRRVMGFTVWKKQPTSEDVRASLGRTISKADAKPKYLISDKGVQFWCKGYKRWCKRCGIKPRFGAVGQYGSIAVIERFIRTLKEGCTRRIVVPLRDATVELPWGAGKPISFADCRVDFVSPEVDANGDYRIWVEVVNRRVADHQRAGQWLLRPGMTATIVVHFAQ